MPSMDTLQNIQFEFKRRILEESFARITQCCGLLSQEELWHRPNQNLVSAANLILHLNGNVRQWILTGVADQADIRERNIEFSSTEGFPAKQLLDQLKETINASIEVVDNLKESDLSKIKEVQGFEETVLSIIMHVIEHFSYHTAQITYYTKWVKNVNTAYYDDSTL